MVSGAQKPVAINTPQVASLLAAAMENGLTLRMYARCAPCAALMVEMQEITETVPGLQEHRVAGAPARAADGYIMYVPPGGRAIALSAARRQT